jgi:uncharacterized membrane protein (DUF485 family)
MPNTAAIRQMPEYIALTAARKRIIWPLATLVISAYFALILTIAFAPAALGTPIGAGITSVGVILGLSIIFLCLVVTGVYVTYANRVIEPLTRAVVQKAGDLK